MTHTPDFEPSDVATQPFNVRALQAAMRVTQGPDILSGSTVLSWGVQSVRRGTFDPASTAVPTVRFIAEAPIDRMSGRELPRGPHHTLVK